MYAGQDAKVAVAERQPTINDRLNKALETISYQCERLEAVLSRINGTPQKIENAKNLNAPRATLSMTNALDALEQATGRLVELSSGIERIA